MTMEKVISYVNTNRGTGRKESLERLYLLLEALDNPHKSLKYIHITGTNGKGSTGALFASILRETGLNVGVFTSPHLEIVNERIRINEEFISDEDFIRMVLAIEPLVLNLEKEMGEKFYAFELLTTVAFLYFQEKQPDIVILEAGIGGRLDATNVIEEAEVSIVTSIGLDHMHVLGETKEEIMLEKVAILKEAGDLVVGPVEANLKEIAKRQADLVNGSVTFIEPIDIEVEETSLKGQVFAYKEWKNLKLSLLGLHQIENASIVLEACEILKEKGWSLPSKMIYRGLEQAHWPGRFEKVLNEPLFYLDGAHNEASVKRLVETLEEVFPNKTFYFVIGMMQDKAYEKMIKEVAHLAEEFILVSPDWQRGFDVNEVAKDLLTAGYPALAKDSVEEVLHYIQQDIPKTATVIQFGSLYLVGDLKRALHMD